MKMQQVLPHGAAANLSSLICQAYDLAKMAVHSKPCSVFLVKQLISIQEAILNDRSLLQPLLTDLPQSPWTLDCCWQMAC